MDTLNNALPVIVIIVLAIAVSLQARAIRTLNGRLANVEHALALLIERIART